MKNYRNALCALLLTLLLSMSVFAGEMHTGIVAPPPPPPSTNGERHTDSTGCEIQIGEDVSTPEATDTVTETALNLLQSVLSLF
ncbi:MAG TPA: hypothetical protein VGB73_18825 [Pyrinomonadaceae bacterium]|jgi:hypothetical protein